MKKRIIKKKENRKINDLVQSSRNERRISHSPYEYTKEDNYDLLIFSNNKRSVYGLPKRNHKRIYRNIVLLAFSCIESFKFYNKAKMISPCIEDYEVTNWHQPMEIEWNKEEVKE